MESIDVYGAYPKHLPIEEEAVSRSTYFSSTLGRVTLKTQIDGYDRFRITNSHYDWYLIEILTQLDDDLNPIVGFVKKRELSKHFPKALVKTDLTLSETALKFLGVPYRWGAKSKVETDCSGLIYQIYREHGIILPRFAHGQFQMTEKVVPGDLRVGDLIFTIVDKPVHVSMYLGNGKLIESSGLPGVFTTRIVPLGSKPEGKLSFRRLK